MQNSDELVFIRTGNNVFSVIHHFVQCVVSHETAGLTFKQTKGEGKGGRSQSSGRIFKRIKDVVIYRSA
jgi:hypothetical protein